MDFGSARIECTAKPITHAFIHFMNDGDRNKFIRSANMLKKEVRGRKIKITRSMDAEERFLNKRMGKVKYCIYTRHNRKTRVSQTTECGENMPKWIFQVLQIPRCSG